MAEQRKQGRADAKCAVIYARYSSSSQTEQSIEGQLRICKEYAERNGYKVISEYVDRAKTGRNANRPAFQNMIADSYRGLFQAVIVYMVDRFARSKEDSVVYKSLLRKNGVKVISATEQIGDTDEGYLVEGLLEMFAEQYSTKLSRRVKNGMIETRAKGNFTGGVLLIGFKVVDHKVVIDEERAPIIRYAFEQYAEGVPMRELVEQMNAKGWRTNTGSKFTVNSLQNALRNKKYIGEYTFNGEPVAGYPVLIDPALFQRVQDRIAKNRHAPATQKAVVEYILYGKAICGICGAHMVGIAGTSRHGNRYHYYACAANYKDKHSCPKKYERKEELEKTVAAGVQEYFLTGDRPALVADKVVEEYKKRLNTGELQRLERQVMQVEKQFDKIVMLMTKTENPDVLTRLNERANDLTEQKNTLEAEISKLKLAIAMPHTKEDLIRFFSAYADGSVDDLQYRKRLFDRLLDSVYVYDDKIVATFRVIGGEDVTLDAIPAIDEDGEVTPECENNKNPSTEDAGVLISSVLAER